MKFLYVDLAGALARQWGMGGITALAPRSTSAVTLRHPHTRDRVQLLGLGVSYAREPPRRDRLAAEPVGTLSIRFGVDASDPACAGMPQPGARALAVLAVRIADAAGVD